MDPTFTLLPLHIDPTSKAVSSPLPHLGPSLTTLTATHRTLLPLQGQIPPPPLPTNPKRSAQIQKMRDQGNTSLRRSTTASANEAVQLYTYGVDMALGRPGWEPAALVRDEAAALYANRAQAYMAVSMWPEGAADGATSVELKRGGNGKAWWRRGKCLAEMGRWEEARTWVKEGLEVEGNEGDLVGLNREIEIHLGK
ncbi:hypothetical protein MMC07_005987 [Pseudocyphellaria aurata]|nr:hypothetical protein [Pseudocyphellaria aurata]